MKTFLQLYSIAKTPKNQNFSLSQIYLISLPPKVYFFHHSLLVAVVVAVAAVVVAGVVLVGPFYKERREKKRSRNILMKFEAFLGSFAERKTF